MACSQWLVCTMGMRMEIRETAGGHNFIAQLIIWKDLIPSLLEMAWPIVIFHTRVLWLARLLWMVREEEMDWCFQLTEENVKSSVLGVLYHMYICLYPTSSAFSFDSQEVPLPPWALSPQEWVIELVDVNFILQCLSQIFISDSCPHDACSICQIFYHVPVTRLLEREPLSRLEDISIE